MLPFFYYYIREWLKGVVENGEDLRKLSEFPILGQIPNDCTMIEEAFHSIRSSLLHNTKDAQKTIMVTSDCPNDGKTFTAIHLAKSLSLIGKKVVLCDLNLHNPSIASQLNIVSSKGWCDILKNEALSSSDVMSVVLKEESGIPDILLPGTIPSVHPANLLAHENLCQIIACLREVYDFIILDISSVGLYDEMLVDGLADTTCYVCRSGKTPKTSIIRLNQLADDNRLPSPNIVINHLITT